MENLLHFLGLSPIATCCFLYVINPRRPLLEERRRSDDRVIRGAICINEIAIHFPMCYLKGFHL